MKKNSIHFALSVLLIIGISITNVFPSSSKSRSSSGSSFKRSSSISKQTPSKQVPTKPSTTITPTKSTTTITPMRSTTSPSTFKSASSTTTSKPKAVSTSSLDKQKAKATAQSNKDAVRKYKSKAEAEQAYRQKLSSSNSYTSATPPASTPSYVPKTIIINNNPVPTSYGALPGGGYGYGHYDPFTHAFVSLAVADMMIDHAALQNNGYGRWRDDGRPIQQTSPIGAIVGLIIVLIVVGFIVFALRK